LFFAKAKELLKLSEADLEVEANTSVTNLYQTLETKWPELSKLQKSFAIALNEEYIDPNAGLLLKSNDILAVIPPISGG